jgi:glycerol dehydrogenase-like iron-containing ADH family enzyme
LDDRGDYLILFQTVSAFKLSGIGLLPAASVSSHAFAYGSRLGDEMLGFLHGERVTCGSFVGRYAAPRS